MSKGGWREKIDALRRLAEDQKGKPEGEVAARKLAELEAKHRPKINLATETTSYAEMRNTFYRVVGMENPNGGDFEIKLNIIIEE